MGDSVGVERGGGVTSQLQGCGLKSMSTHCLQAFCFRVASCNCSGFLSQTQDIWLSVNVCDFPLNS